MHEFIKSRNIPEVSPMGSYSPEDVVFLLKNIGGLIGEKDTEEREKAIQLGKHYSEMLPVEYKPSPEYMDLFYASLQDSAEKIAVAAGIVSTLIIDKLGSNVVLVSLARAGTPVGILIKRYIKYKYKIALPHYSLSIIRGKGIDENAVFYILKNHPASRIQFIDGWTGKGAITKVLNEACRKLTATYGIALDSTLAVLADPGYCTNIFGTREDFLLPSACLNSTVSGLVSRTVLRDDLIGENDFHGAKFYNELREEDVSNLFIDTITEKFEHLENQIAAGVLEMQKTSREPTWSGLKSIEQIRKDFEIADINMIKPGIGETTRVLLRRIPWKILVRDKKNPNLKHIVLLAKDRNVPVEVYKSMSYECCGLIKNLRSDV